MTRAGLRADQAVAAFLALTDGRRVSVINAPAGSGKTWVLAGMGLAWAGAGLGRVVGVTPSQSARNTLAAGVAESYNATMADRQVWEQATAGRRRLAVAADAEIRRRHPGQRCPPLRSAEPAPVTSAQASELILVPGQPVPGISGWIRDLAARHDAFARQFARRQHPAREGDQEIAGFGQVSWPWASPGEEPLLQPPRPMIEPSARVMDRLSQREAGLEATT